MSGLAPARPEVVTERVPQPRQRWIELTTSADHKDVGRLYIGASLSFLVVGVVAFLLMRLQLAVPENDLIEPNVFNRLLSVTGASLVVLFAIPFALGLYTFLVPLQIGARSLAFPRLASVSFWLYVLGGATLFGSFAYTPPESGPSPIPPLSDIAFIANNGVDVWIAGVGTAVIGFVIQAIDLIVTLRRLRAPGMAWRRLPLFSWSGAISSYVLLVTGSLMVAALTMLEIDRHFSGVFFDPGEGGAPVYFQHLSWLFFTGAYLVMVLPAIGAISEILPTFAGKPLFHRRTVTASMATIAVLGVLAWMQNMFTGAISTGFLYFAMAAAIALIVPFGLILFNWIATIAGGALSMRAPLLFAIASISTLTLGLAGELMHSVVPVNWYFADTADATAATGFVFVGGAVLGGLAALHYWYPKMTGRTMGETLARISLANILIGTYVTLIPMILAGTSGQPVDIYKYYEDQGLATYNLISTIGAFILAAGILVSIANAIVSVKGGARAGHDPWGGETLEWYALSPPPEHNFDVIPDVRSAEPLRDVREAVEARSGAASTQPAGPRQPVA